MTILIEAAIYKQTLMNETEHIPRAIELSFPIVEINRLAVPERNSFKPIYQMHKWFARRASCVFRAILLGSLKPAFKPDGTPTNLMEEFYKDHTNDPDTAGKTVLDPFMGGGTTVVEALRLGCKVVGIDLNPVAWFIVKTEVEPVDLESLQSAFERLAERPVDWNENKPLRETLLDLYRTEIEPGIEADVIYTFWVKHAICTDPNCKRQVPLFEDYIIAKKTPSIRYHHDVTCPHCKKVYDWEIEVASLIADPRMMVNASRGSAGEGRPTQAWAYAPPPEREHEIARVICPHCQKTEQPELKHIKSKRKRVSLTVLFCPECEAVWQWRGDLPEKEVTCPACRHEYDPRKGNIPSKGKFLCRCGNVDKIIESIRRLPKDQRLPVRPYAIQAYIPPANSEEEGDEDPSLPLLGNCLNSTQKKIKRTSNNSKFVTPAKAGGSPVISIPLKAGLDSGFCRNDISRGSLKNNEVPKTLLLPKNGKFFKRFTPSDMTKLKQSEILWESSKESLPYPKSKIPRGAETGRLLEHHYNYWHEMFLPRQLLALSTLLKGIMAEKDETLKEMLLSVMLLTLDSNNLFCRFRSNAGMRSPFGGLFSRHDFQPKVTTCEINTFGAREEYGPYISNFLKLKTGKIYNYSPFDRKMIGQKQETIESNESTFSGNWQLSCKSSSSISDLNKFQYVITDPPYVGNVNYSELSDFFYVWLRLALKDRYPHFAPEYTPKAEEIVENRTRGKSREDFFNDLEDAFACIHKSLPDEGLLVFTFHHTDEEGLVWEGLLQSLCDTGFEILSVYPIHGESESSLHLMDKENISYDLIHVCKKRKTLPETRSWAGIRQEVRKKARAELAAIEAGRYGKEPLGPNDVRLICIGKCLELYSRHYGKVVNHEGKEFKLHEALQDIGTIVDQLVTKEKPLPPELDDVDSISYAYLRVLLDTKMEINVNDLTKSLRAMRVNVEDLKKEGLIIKGRTGRGRYFKVKQPDERLNPLKEKLEPSLKHRKDQLVLFDEMNRPVIHSVNLVDLVHLLIGLAWTGESVAPWLERFSHMRPKVRAALHHIRDRRKDWKDPINRILNLLEGTLFSRDEKN